MRIFRTRMVRRDDGTLFLQLSDDLADLHNAYGQLIIERYRKNKRGDITGSMLEPKKRGFIGQRVLQSFFNQWRIPYCHDDFAFLFPEDRLPHDFIIHNFGSIEVKTGKENHNTLVINEGEWDSKDDKPDYVIAIRLLEHETNAQVMGYCKGSEVIELHSEEKAELICQKASCYAIPYENLHDFQELFEKLQECSMDKSKCVI